MKNKGGFVGMVSAILGVVLVTSMFATVMTQLGNVYGHASASSFIAFTTVVGIAPTVLILATVLGGGLAYGLGLRQVGKSGSDPSGLMRMVMGVLAIILFAALFSTILTNFGTLYTSYSSNTDWIAFGTVISILPTILFLGGIFAGGATVYSGYKARRGRRSGAF